MCARWWVGVGVCELCGFVVRMRSPTNSQGHAPGADCYGLPNIPRGEAPRDILLLYIVFYLLLLGGFISPTSSQGMHLGQIVMICPRGA